MKKRLAAILIVLSLLVSSTGINAIGPNIEIMWNQQYGQNQNDSFKDIVETADGDYLAIGSITNSITPPGLGGLDGLIMKFDEAGNVLWEKIYGGTDTDYLSSIIATQDGNYVVAGYSQSNLAPDPNRGQLDGWIFKIDPDGNMLWSHTYGGGLNEYLSTIVETSTGYAAVGRSNGGAGVQAPIGISAYDSWVLRISATGAVQTSKIYGTTDEDNALSLVVESDDSLVFVGSTAGQIGLDPSQGTIDGYAIKVDSADNIVWSHQYGSAAADNFFDIMQGTDGNYYIIGNTYGQMGIQPPMGQSDGILMSIDGLGTTLWTEQYGGIGEDYLYSINKANSGGFLLGGATRTNVTNNTNLSSLDGWVLEVTTAGTILWNKNIGTTTTEVINSAINTSLNRIVTMGASYGDISGTGANGGSDAWIMQLGLLFDVVFEENGGTTVSDQAVFENHYSTEPTAPTKTGNTFNGWYQDQLLTDVWDFVNDPVISDMTLYADWLINSYELSFDVNGGDSAAPATQTLDYGTLASEPTIPTKEGYTFIEWNTAQDGSGTVWDFATETMPDNDVVLYAQWAINNYELSFELNGGDSAAPIAQSLEYGTLASEPTLPAKTGHTFTEWNTTQDGSGTTWDFTTTTMPANDVILYAQWSANAYELSFDVNSGDSVAPAMQSLKYGTLGIEPTIPIKQNYTFIEWNTAKDGSGSTWNFVTTTMPANNVIVYAQWEKNEIPETTQNLETTETPGTSELPKTGYSNMVRILTSLGAMLFGLMLFLLSRNRK